MITGYRVIPKRLVTAFEVCFIHDDSGITKFELERPDVEKYILAYINQENRLKNAIGEYDNDEF